MTYFIGLQAGHQNITSNPDPLLAAETGAPGEEPFNVSVRDQLSTYLQAYGFEVQLDDANANNSPNTTTKDFDLYLAIHAEGAPAGGNVVPPDPSVDASNAVSIRLAQAIASAYFSDTGIVNDGLVTNNETFYYMWSALSQKTPCALIECGDLQDPHDSVILGDIRRVALAIAHGICLAFSVKWKGDPATWAPEGTTTPASPLPPPASTTTPSVSVNDSIVAQLMPYLNLTGTASWEAIKAAIDALKATDAADAVTITLDSQKIAALTASVDALQIQLVQLNKEIISSSQQSAGIWSTLQSFFKGS